MLGKSFYVAIAFGLLINLVGDLSVYRQTLIEADTGRWIEESYKILRIIDAAKIKVYESRGQSSLDPSIKNQFGQLQASLRKLPNQEERLGRLLALDQAQLVAKNNNPALRILGEMGAVEINLLEDRLKRDHGDHFNAGDQIIIANILDLTLMLIVFSFFISDRRTGLKMQRAMTSALAHVESVNQSLMLSMSKKDSKFKSTVHDLKNPLGSIKGFAELLQDEEGNSISTLEMVKIIKRISVNTLNLVESVLHVENEEDESDLKAKEHLKVLDCLKETCRFLEPIARNKKQTINIEIETFTYDFAMWASRHKLQDIFYNIIGNALKYSPLGSAISVSCKRLDDFHRIEVSDQGPGFTADDFAKMFTPGATLSAKPTGGETASGIGLFSVKNSLEELEAKLDIINNPDHGACVRLSFPVRVTLIPAKTSLTLTDSQIYQQ